MLALRLILSNPLDAISMLYLFPIALLAMAKGRWGGLLGGLVAVVLVGVWVLVRSVDLNAVGWLSRVLLLLVGALIGDARDRLARAAAEHAVHEAAVQRHREAIEINDSLVQGMSAAKWSIEGGSHPGRPGHAARDRGARTSVGLRADPGCRGRLFPHGVTAVAASRLSCV